MTTLLRRLATFAVSVAMIFVLGGCPSTAASLCDDACDCEGCSDREYDDCLDNVDDLERDADREDCLDDYDDYIACLEDTGECRHDDKWETDCGDEHHDLDRCLD